VGGEEEAESAVEEEGGEDRRGKGPGELSARVAKVVIARAAEESSARVAEGLSAREVEGLSAGGAVAREAEGLSAGGAVELSEDEVLEEELNAEGAGMAKLEGLLGLKDIR
jgi:hypothetical protein